MNLIAKQPNPSWTIEQLRGHFGMIPAERILLDPPPGTATEEDVLFMDDHHDRLCELVDGVLVEKIMGLPESALVDINPGRVQVPMPNGVRHTEGGQFLERRLRLPEVPALGVERPALSQAADAIVIPTLPGRLNG